MQVAPITLLISNNGESPFYVYDEQLILDNIRRFKSIPYKNTRIRFASMANDNPVLLKLLKRAEVGLFVNSRKHLKLGFECGFEAQDMIFASTGVSASTMQLLARLGVHMNIDSPDQLALYGRLNPGAKVGIRLNVDEKSKNNISIGMESRIGILESELTEVFAIADEFRLRLTGTHTYLGTNVTQIADLLSGVDKTLALSEHFKNLEFVDVGGGFPIENDRFDFDSYKALISDKLERYSRKRGTNIQLVLEPGRVMFGNTASFYVQVTDVKKRPDRYLVCVNASASLIPRAMFYEDYNPISKVSDAAEDAPFDKTVDVVGNTTYSRDYIARNIELPKVKRGDWLRLHNAGSYCYSMVTRFLGQELPTEYLVGADGKIQTIRNGEVYFGEPV